MEPPKDKKAFIIVIGDTGEFTKALEHYKPRQVINGERQYSWKFVRTEKAFYWILGETVQNITRQFMNFVHPVIYLIINFKSSSYMESLEKGYKMVSDDLLEWRGNTRIRPTEIVVVGVNYDEKKGISKMKENVLRWCVEQKANLDDIIISYVDLENWNEL